MHALDLSPLFRSSVGFDHLSRVIDAHLKNDDRAPAYPPYNIVKMSDDDYEIVMAVAGFKQEEISITAQNNQLTVAGAASEKEEHKGADYLHRGIAARSFERKFSLADHVKVVEARLADGLLTLKLKREVPEESKPRLIPINGESLIEGKTKK